MREPRYGYTEETAVAYSQLPVEDLREVLARDVTNKAGEFYDRSFRRWYAAKLLRERGL